jgi:hypothetical protein
MTAFNFLSIALDAWRIIRGAPDQLKIRLEAKQAAEDASTWEQVYANARAYLASQDLGNVTITRPPEPPMRDPKSGKFRNVWKENRSAACKGKSIASRVALGRVRASCSSSAPLV